MTDRELDQGGIEAANETALLTDILADRESTERIVRAYLDNGGRASERARLKEKLGSPEVENAAMIALQSAQSNYIPLSARYRTVQVVLAAVVRLLEDEN